jgi:hypothetical protein
MTADEGDDERWRTNRVKKTEPRGDHSAWCPRCDRALVRDGERCPECGTRITTKHRKP